MCTCFSFSLLSLTLRSYFGVGGLIGDFLILSVSVDQWRSARLLSVSVDHKGLLFAFSLFSSCRYKISAHTVVVVLEIAFAVGLSAQP